MNVPNGSKLCNLLQSLGQIVKTGSQMEKYKSGEYAVVKCAKMRAYSEYMVSNGHHFTD